MTYVPARKNDFSSIPVGEDPAGGVDGPDINGLIDHAAGSWNAKATCQCDGATNDYAALSALVTQIGSTNATLVIPATTKVDSNLTIPSNIRVRFEGTATFTGSGTVTYTRWGMEAWTALTLLNSWTVYSGRTPGFLVDAFGFVHLRGVAVGGAAGTVMATLPVGRRPTMSQIFPVATQLSTAPSVDGAIRSQVSTNGNIELAINPPSGWVTGTWVDLSTITFRAEQ